MTTGDIRPPQTRLDESVPDELVVTVFSAAR